MLVAPQMEAGHTMSVVLLERASMRTLSLALAMTCPSLAGQVTAYGTGCGGCSAGAIGAPEIGELGFELTLVGAEPASAAVAWLGVSDQAWEGFALPLDLAFLGAPGCQLLTSGELAFVQLASPSGEAAQSLPLPNNPALIGASVYAQWSVLEAGANALGLVFSDALRFTFQAPSSLEDGLYLFLAEQLVPSTGLLESYRSNPGLPASFANYLADARPAFLYDNALAALALLERGTPEDLVLAAGILDAFVGLQEADGKLPNVVHVATLAPNSPPHATGNQAWALLALVQGFESLGKPAYLAAAEALADYCITQTHGAVGYGGFRLNPTSAVVSTEHNLDLYPALSRLAPHLSMAGSGLTQPDALAAAEHARLFCESKFDAVLGATYTGTGGGGVLANKYPVPTDVQTWAVLSLGRSKWGAGHAWLTAPVPAGLWTSSSASPSLDGTPIVGPPFSNADTDEVWFEGLGQGLLSARTDGDAATVSSALATLDAVRLGAEHADGLGLVATLDTLATGFGFEYFSALHVGATAWAAMGVRDHNPYWGVPASGGYAAHPAAQVPTIELTPPAGGAYDCSGLAPCFFTVSGTSSGVFGAGLELTILIEPDVPTLGGAKFIQATDVSVNPDGTWSGLAQLGDPASPVTPGDPMRLHVLVTPEGGAPEGVLFDVTAATVPGLVTVAGVLDATAN